MITKLILILSFTASLLSAEEKYKGMAVNIPDWIEAENIVEICYYKHVFTTGVPNQKKGEHIRSGVITRVIKGALKVGTQVERTNLSDANLKTPSFNKIVEGEIEVVFLNKDDIETNKKGTLQTFDWVPHFTRVTNKDCWRALQIELAKSAPPSTKKAHR